MNPSIWIAARLRLNDTGSGANTTGVAIASIGVAVAVAVMEITLGVVMGFKTGITDRVLGFDPEVSVLPAYDYPSGESDPHISASPELLGYIASSLPQASASISLSQPGIIKTDSDFAALYFMASDTTHDFSFERGNIVDGTFPDYSDPRQANSIVVSSATAHCERSREIAPVHHRRHLRIRIRGT